MLGNPQDFATDKVAKSKHLKGQLDPPVGDEKYVLVTKNDHFLKGPVFVT